MGVRPCLLITAQSTVVALMPPLFVVAMDEMRRRGGVCRLGPGSKQNTSLAARWGRLQSTHDTRVDITQKHRYAVV